MKNPILFLSFLKLDINNFPLFSGFFFIRICCQSEMDAARKIAPKAAKIPIQTYEEHFVQIFNNYIIA